MGLLAAFGGGAFWLEFAQKMFRPLLFFYAGFLIPLLKVPYKFPQQVYQGMVLYLLTAIGWHGGEDLAKMSGQGISEAMGFMGIGFVTNSLISILAYFMLRKMTRMRCVDCATVGGCYGSDSAGIFLTCVGVLMVMGFKEMGYMPVLLAVMVTPDCLVCLYQIARFRHQGMDRQGKSNNIFIFSWSILHEVFLNRLVLPLRRHSHQSPRGQAVHPLPQGKRHCLREPTVRHFDARRPILVPTGDRHHRFGTLARPQKGEAGLYRLRPRRTEPVPRSPLSQLMVRSTTHRILPSLLPCQITHMNTRWATYGRPPLGPTRRRSGRR